MSGIQCDTRRAEDEKERNKHETDSNLVPDDGNGDKIVNNDNEKMAQEPVMHTEIPIHDEGNKIEGNDTNDKDNEGTPEQTKEPKKDDNIIQSKKQDKNLKKDNKVEKTQKIKEKITNKKHTSSRKKGKEEENVWIAYPCSVCSTGVGNNSCQCNECKKWVHLKCSGLSSLVKHGAKYKCPKCAEKEKKRGPGRPRSISLTLEQESARAIRKFIKSKRRARDDDSPEKPSSKPKNNKDPESSPHNKKTKAGKDQGGDEGDDDESEDEEEETEEEDKDEEAEVVWLGQKHNKKVNNKCQRKGYEKLLDYDGGHLTEEDLISLNDRNYVTDSILLLFITMLRKNKEWAMDRNKIKIVDPSVAHLLKNYRCLDTICNQKTEQKLNEYDWVMYPVNNDAPEGNGGTHWSLLVYRKRDNKFLHFDPIRGLNNKHARSRTNVKNTRCRND